MITRAGPAMLARTRQILSEFKEVWPLASRWMEGLDKFGKDRKSMMASYEGSMAEGVRIFARHLPT